MTRFNSKAILTNDIDYSCNILNRCRACLAKQMGFISRPIRRPVICSLRGRYTHIHTQTHTHTQPHKHAYQCPAQNQL